jgi:hypothetical protein
MPDYQKMYHSLFNDVTDAIAKLQQAQQKTEEVYIDSRESVLSMLHRGDGNKHPEPTEKRPTPPKKKPPSHER